MNSHGVILLTSVLAIAMPSAAAAAAQDSHVTQCRPTGPLVQIPDLPEASGLAVSALPGRLWTHNDSGQAQVFALDVHGKVTARVQITGATVEDWEAIAVGPCPDGSCLFIADIGDNSAKRQNITVYRLAEPSGKDASSVAVADVIQMKYPDGAHDAEALLVTPDGTILVVTKGETGPVNVYRVPANARRGATVTLERIGGSIQGKAGQDQRITDGAVSPDGQWVALRSRGSLVFFQTTDFLKGQWNEARRVDLSGLGEPQGEGIALGSNNTVYLAGEGGGKGQPGTLTRFTCELQP